MQAPARHSITIKSIVSFCFPDNEEHTNSTARLYLLADCGPLYHEHAFLSCLCVTCQRKGQQYRKKHRLTKEIFHGQLITPEMLFPGDGNDTDDEKEQNQRVEDASHLSEWICEDCQSHIRHMHHIKGGFMGKHIVTRLEILEMEKQLLRDLALACYNKKADFPVAEQEWFLANMDPTLRDIRNVTRADIKRLFRDVADEGGTMDFEDYKRIVNAKRKAWIEKKKKMDSSTAAATKSNQKKKRVSAQKYQTAQITRSLMNRKIPDHQTFKLTTRLLHSQVHKITTMASKNEHNLTHNVYLMRDLKQDGESGWDSNCMIKGKGKGSYVNAKKI